MAKKPESRYIDKVHRQLTKLHSEIILLRMSMMPGSTAGVADILYENQDRLWVEYKHVPNLLTIRKLPINKISANQIVFLRTRVQKNINCAVIFGDDKGNGFILEKNDLYNTLISNLPPNINNVKTNLFTPKEIADYIKTNCNK